MRVVHLATTERGGAGIAARRLHEGLRRLDVDSRMLVRTSGGAVEHLDVIDPVSTSLVGKARRRFDRWRFARQWRQYAAARASGRSYVTDDRVAGRFTLDKRLPEADVYHLHWITGFVDPFLFFSELPPGVPIVWTLHDMNTFTGGCHYSAGCSGFREDCGCCPQLGSQSPTDPTARSHARKQRAYSRLRPATTRIVTPSRWLASEVRQSSLLRDLPVEVIPYALDVDVFTPSPKAPARQRFNLPPNGPVIAFIADQVALHLKGLDLLYQALEGLSDFPDLTVAVIGGGPQNRPVRPNVAWLGRIEDEKMMALALSAADVFVVPSRADNLPNVLLEAIACGTPVVGFETGGIPDVVRHGETGFLAPQEDAAALGRAIGTLLKDEHMRGQMARECRRVAETEYSLEIQASRYVGLYGQIVMAREH